MLERKHLPSWLSKMLRKSHLVVLTQEIRPRYWGGLLRDRSSGCSVSYRVGNSNAVWAILQKMLSISSWWSRPAIRTTRITLVRNTGLELKSPFRPKTRRGNRGSSSSMTALYWQSVPFNFQQSMSSCLNVLLKIYSTSVRASFSRQSRVLNLHFESSWNF